MKKFENTEKRHRLIKELFNKHAHPDIPKIRTYNKYVKPVYPISRTTFYKILNTVEAD